MLGSVGIFQKTPEYLLLLYNNPEVNAQCCETSEDEEKEKKGQKGGREGGREGRKEGKVRRQKEKKYLLDFLTFFYC